MSMRQVLGWVVLGCVAPLLLGCVQEKVNDADFKWTTSTPQMSPKTTGLSTPQYNYTSPVSETKYRSMGLSDAMGKVK